MFSLIITIFAIALVIALILVTAYYGGPIFMGNSARIAAETLINQSIQIGAARQIAIAQGRALPGGTLVNLPADLLSSMPTPPASAYVSGSPAQDDWEYYVPGVSPHFGIPTKINKKACMEINKGQGFIGIPAAWDGTSAIQCFGPSPTGYTYLFQPTGTTPQQRDAILQHAIDLAKPDIPSAAAGYPRLCPNGETISAGVCEGGTAAPKPSGFWLITATASGSYSTGLDSGGYSATCPAGAIDPTGPDVSPTPSQAGEPFSVDGLVELEWTLPPDYGSNFQTPLTRTWCIPANEDEVLDSVSTGSSGGGVQNVTQVVVPSSTNTNPESYTSSYNRTALITAGGQQWALLASVFQADTDNPVTGDSVTMLGHKVAIGKVTTATQSYFVNSPAVTYNGTQYQNTAGTITFPTPQPPCQPLAKNVPLGTGGRIVDIFTYQDTSILLKEDGSVWTTGTGYEGLLGNCSYDDRATWTRVATGATKIMAARGGFYFIKGDGTVWGTGDLTAFLGDAYSEALKFTQVPVSNVADLASGITALFVQRTDGTLWQLTKELWDNTGRDFSNPIQVASGVLKAFPDGNGFYVLKTDHTVWFQVYGGSNTKVLDNVAQFSLGNGAMMWLGMDGFVYAKGSDPGRCNIFGQNSATWSYATATRIAASIGAVKSLELYDGRSYILGTNGTLYAAGCNDSWGDISYFGDGTSNNRPTYSAMASGVKMFSGPFIINTSEALFATGYNYVGQFGNGNEVDTKTFVPIAY